MEFHWRPLSPGCRSYSFRQNLIVSPKCFKNLVKMNVFTIRSCASPSPARSGPWLRSWIPRGSPSKTIGNPCVSEVPLLGIHWRPLCQGCRPHRHRQNLTVSLKQFKNLVKMNNFTIRSCTSPSPARSGPRLRSRIPRGGPSKTIGKPCVSEVPLLEIHWRPLCQGCRPYHYRQNLTVSLKPFKTL